MWFRNLYLYRVRPDSPRPQQPAVHPELRESTRQATARHRPGVPRLAAISNHPRPRHRHRTARAAQGAGRRALAIVATHDDRHAGTQTTNTTQEVIMSVTPIAPHTLKRSTFDALATKYDMSIYVIKQRWATGVRGPNLVAKGQSSVSAKKEFATTLAYYLVTPEGVFNTYRRLGDYGRAIKQAKRPEAA